MAWAEENGIDIGYELPHIYSIVESNWENGKHIDQNGVHHKISELSDSHLENIIRYFKKNYSGIDVSPLIKERKKRIKLKD